MNFIKSLFQNVFRTGTYLNGGFYEPLGLFGIIWFAL